MEFTGIELFIPAIVSAIIVGIRQATDRLDGPAAYWWSIALNIIGQVVVGLSTGGAGVIEAAALGAGTGAVVSPGLAMTAKRLGAAKIVSPRQGAPTLRRAA